MFDHEKDQNRDFCQARTKVYELGYLLRGWISSIEYASREKHKKTSKIQGPLNVLKANVYNN